MPSDGASRICNMCLKLAKSVTLRLGLGKNFRFSAKKISFLGPLDLGESKQFDSNGPPFQRPIFLKLTSSKPPGGFHGYPQGVSRWKNPVYIWLRQGPGQQRAFRKIHRIHLKHKCSFQLAQMWPQRKFPPFEPWCQPKKRLSPAKRQNYVHTYRVARLRVWYLLNRWMKGYDFWDAGAEFNLVFSHNEKKSTIIESTVIAYYFDGTHVGHHPWGCGHNSDAEQIFLFLRILWVDCDKNWYGLPLVIGRVHREKKFEKPLY